MQELLEKSSLQFFTITPKNSILEGLNLKGVWQFRELLMHLAVREIKVRYKQAALGFSWVLFQPIASVLVFSIFFGKVLGGAGDRSSYALLTMMAVLPWNFFSSAITRSSLSLVSSSNLIGKVYFPRIIIPLASILSAFFDFLVSWGFFLLVAPFLGVPISLSWLFLSSLLIVFVFCFSFGVSLFLSALNVKYRDVTHVLPFIMQLWMFSTPIFYSSGFLSEKFLKYLWLNPMAVVIEGFRIGMQNSYFDWAQFAFSCVLCVFILASGLVYFAKFEKTFADLI